jgi:hypothetical protein
MITKIKPNGKGYWRCNFQNQICKAIVAQTIDMEGEVEEYPQDPNEILEDTVMDITFANGKIEQVSASDLRFFRHF